MMLVALALGAMTIGAEPDAPAREPRVFGATEFGWSAGPRIRLSGDFIPRGNVYTAFVECRVEAEGKLADCTATEANPPTFAAPVVRGMRFARIRDRPDGPKAGDTVAFEYRIRF